MLLNTSNEAWQIFLTIAKKGLVTKTKWESPKLKKIYAIYAIEPERVIVTRERGNNSRIVPSDLTRLLRTVNQMGKVSRKEYTHASVAQLSTMVHFHPNLGWSEDFNWIEITNVQGKDSLKYEHFGSPPNDNINDLQVFARRLRKGQPIFRKGLLKLYEGKCCVTDTQIEELLEACHIEAHVKQGINKLGNGLLLRSDIHLLFDCGLLFIEPNTMLIHLHPKLLGTSYKIYHLKKINKRINGENPDNSFILQRWEEKTF